MRKAMKTCAGHQAGTSEIVFTLPLSAWRTVKRYLPPSVKVIGPSRITVVVTPDVVISDGAPREKISAPSRSRSTKTSIVTASPGVPDKITINANSVVHGNGRGPNDVRTSSRIAATPSAPVVICSARRTRTMRAIGR